MSELGSNLKFVGLRAWEYVMRRDLDEVIQGWPYDTEPSERLAREVRARDGRKVLQVRIELGVLQLEVTGRPDGVRPHGFVTYLDYLRHSATGRGQTPAQVRRAGPCRLSNVRNRTASSSSSTIGGLRGGPLDVMRERSAMPITRSR